MPVKLNIILNCMCMFVNPREYEQMIIESTVSSVKVMHHHRLSHYFCYTI